MLETVNGFGFRRVFGLFWPLFDSFCGGSIRKLIQPPQKEVENRLKRTEKSTETKSVNSLLTTNRKKFLIGTFWFTAVQLVQLSWMTSIEFQGYYILLVYSLLSLWLGCQFGVLTLFVSKGLGRISMQKALFCASLWTLMEWARL